MNKERNNQRMPDTTDRAALLEEIRALTFTKAELELYLDTHPRCRTAIDYYHQNITALRDLTELYESLYGPITAAGSHSTDYWSWVDAPWPWQRMDENTENRWKEG